MTILNADPAPFDVPSSEPVEPPQGDQRIEFTGVGWAGYEALLAVQGEKSRPQMIYLDGDVLLMSPSHLHERFVERFGAFMNEVIVGLEIPCIATGETTFRLGKKDGGVQPDKSYYFANHLPIADKDEKSDIDLQVDPPPDLVIEVVHTHDAKAAVEVLRRFGVPEVWVCHADGLRILIRNGRGRYVEASRSLCLPFLSADEIFGWVGRPGQPITTQWIIDVRRWVRDVLVPRVRA